MVGGASGRADPVRHRDSARRRALPAIDSKQGFIGIGKTFKRGEMQLLGDYLEMGESEKVTITLSFTAYLGSRGRMRRQMKLAFFKRGSQWLPTVMVLTVVLLAGGRLITLSVQQRAEQMRETAEAARRELRPFDRNAAADTRGSRAQAAARAWNWINCCPACS